MWYVDPLDGTTNFVHGHPFFCVAVGLMAEEQPVVGAVVAPVLGVRWCGFMPPRTPGSREGEGEGEPLGEARRNELARQLPPAPRQPRIILMSGHNTHVDPVALEAEGVGYLSKPFDSASLLRLVRQMLDDASSRSG